MVLLDEQRQFIREHLSASVAALLLKYGKNREVEIRQIEARQKAKQKLPSWYAEERLIFPPAVSVEQSSSETTGRYKAALVSGTLMDATGGMGIDVSFFAKNCTSVLYVEQKPELVERARYNLGVLGLQNVQCLQGNSLEILPTLDTVFDWIYLDPARRSADNRRVVGLRDCEPDVVTHLPLLLQKAKRLLIKASPLLDLKQTLLDLPQLSVIHVVSVENECKELLFELSSEAQPTDSPTVRTINFKSDDTVQRFDFEWNNEASLAVTLSDPQTYLYEPNASVLKAGAFKSVANAYGVEKIAPHSHLYTSATLVERFPGRIFQVEAVVKVDSKALAPFLPDGKANLTVRNFPLSTDELRKKLKLKEGGNIYIFATTLANGDKRLLVCKKPI
ncbi:MAG TPA: SAM-dependent methyltransferase [Runella sp.]|nr:SAM-dependent methyltransferase [Runella sp.]